MVVQKPGQLVGLTLGPVGSYVLEPIVLLAAFKRGEFNQVFGCHVVVGGELLELRLDFAHGLGDFVLEHLSLFHTAAGEFRFLLVNALLQRLAFLLK